ncbi:MAG: imidazole glycerol phosphate synthase subunit HisH [Polyangiaceae bacterium]
MKVDVIETGTANMASVMAGLRRAGAEPRVTTDPDDEGIVVLPGVGAFGAGMERLVELGLVDRLRKRLLEGRPTLAVCLGLQLLAEASEESPGVTGLSVLPARVERFKTPSIIPQLGWNRVWPETSELVEEGYAYYANSYRLAAIPEGWRGALSQHGETFVAALEREQVLACQFHPELSGAWGQALLERWLDRVKGAA